MLVALFLSAVLAAEPDAAVPPPKLLVEVESEVAFGEAISIDATKSENLVDVTFMVYPRKKVHLDSGGRSAFFFAKPGSYTIFIVASGQDKKLVQQEKQVVVQPLSAEEWEALAPPEVAGRQSPQRPTSRVQAASPPQSLAPDPYGLREDVEALYKDVRSNSKFTQRASMSVLYGEVAKQIEDKAVTGDEANRVVGDLLKAKEAALQENWVHFSTSLAARLNNMAKDGQLATPADWATAYRSVAGVLREVR